MKLFWRTTCLVLLCLGLGTFPQASWGSRPLLGRPAPDFQVKSGDNQSLSLNMIRGKVIVLFYESRDAIKKNSPLKDELKRLYVTQPADVQNNIFRLVVIDCSEAFWPQTPIWKSKLKEHSRKEGFTIYGDWDQRMLADYQLKPGDSNFLIIDKQGVIRYAAAHKIDNGQFEQIKDILFSLVQE